MPFELESPTPAKITDVLVLADKDRAPDTDPGAGLDVQITTSNSILSTLDGAMRGILYTKNANSSPTSQQTTLEGVEPVSDMPNLTTFGQKLGQFGWDLELTSSDVKEKVHGKLALIKTRELPITLVAPDVQQQDIQE